MKRNTQIMGDATWGNYRHFDTKTNQGGTAMNEDTGGPTDDEEGPPQDPGDLLDDPRTDVEALCLSALLWTTSADALRVIGVLGAHDFDRPVYGSLFGVIATQVQAGKPHDPACISAALAEGGHTAGHRGVQLTRALSEVTAAGGVPQAAPHYALAVASAAYRRGFHTAAASMTQAAAELAQDMLFDHLLSIGREQRAATERLHHVAAVLG
jgi:replicative DNA helicase